MNIDWDAVKVQYEIFHEDVRCLAAENKVNPALIEYAVKERGWKRAPMKGIMHDVKDIYDLEEITDDILNAAGERLTTINMLKAVTMNPKYVALENAIIAKAMEVVNSLMPQAPTAGDQLKKVADLLSSLRAKSIPSAGVDKSKDDGRVVVQIMNTVDLVQSSKEPTPVVTAIGSSAGAQ